MMLAKDRRQVRPFLWCVMKNFYFQIVSTAFEVAPECAGRPDFASFLHLNLHLKIYVIVSACF